MANSATHDAIERLLQKFLRDELPNLTPSERAALEAQFEDRFNKLVEASTNGGGYSFPNLIGFGPDGVKPFDDLPYPRLRADFDESVVPSQVHAAAELYFIYQNERLDYFKPPAASPSFVTCPIEPHAPARRPRTINARPKSGPMAATNKCLA
jgi:hypothetical protein